MEEETKIYVQHLKDGAYKSILENFSCTDCGLAPHYKLEQMINGKLEINFESEKWGRVNEQVKCPQCMRRIKIEMLKITK